MRRLVGELMDEPGLDPGEHQHALGGLARINRVSLAARSIFLDVHRLLGGERRGVLVDVAAGGADVSLALWRMARARGVDLRLVALDRSPLALEVARSRARRFGAEIETIEGDAVDGPIPEGDVVICSLFLHHLDGASCVASLRTMARAARRGLVVSDLRRGAWGTTLAQLTPRLLTRSRVVHVDAVRSARAAWSLPELRELAGRAGLDGGRVRAAYPARTVLTWTR